MKKIFTLGIYWLVATVCYGQVKSNYQYSTTMPYGTLDIRTRISSSDYYYLKENQTFSFRESSPGVRTNTYQDMTSWDSSPYREGNLRRKTGTIDKFVMNYRLLLPMGYSSTYAQGYPMMVHFHGAVERGNCYYDNCYHSTPEYTVEANSPPAPNTATHRLLNNDHNLNVGGKQYLDARNLAGTRKPDDPSMPERAFPGFVLSAQMFNIWDSLQVEDVIRIVRLVAEQYNIDEDRIYVQGLSIGGYAVYESMKRASWLFAAGLPMSAVWDANIFTQNQQEKVAHIPLWVFQGGTDTRPSPAFTEAIINKYKEAGGLVRYTLYPTLGHVIWNSAYRTTDYFSWMLKQSKANLHAFAGNTVIDESKNLYPKLYFAEGFLAYQWEKDGVILNNSTHTLTVTTTGKYRARFSRMSSSPTESEWNRWSSYVTITQTGSSTGIVTTTITSPEEGQTFTAPATVNITATASDTDGTISKVEFYNGATKLGEDATSPYSFTWSNVQAGNYSLTVKAIDNSGDSATDMVDITVNNESSGESCASTGKIQAELWTGISGTDIASIPVNSPPSSVSDLTIFETPANIGDNYGSRVRGYICVPTTGDYTFWVASDDRSELWLSTDQNPANKARIAYVSGWTSRQQWDKYASQKSATIGLVAGRRYYIEALLKEGTSGDHLAVGWQLPTGTLERPIPGTRLIPFQNSANDLPTVNITSPDDGQSFTAPASISITATASDSDGSISTLEFYNGGTKLGEDATSPYSFTWTNVPAGDYSLTVKAIDNSGGSANDVVGITVNGVSSGESCASTGKIQAELWTGISGSEIGSIPVNSPPSSVSDLTLLETQANLGDNYGIRVRGYICVPLTGSYFFWTASDDRSELWLSTDENPANKARIAYVTGWTYQRQWDKYASQKSTAISLVAGRRYYIEALLKEGTGGDHLSAGWQLPDGTFERPIAGNRLIPFQSSTNNPPTVDITSPDEGQSFTAPASVTITATASDSDGSLSKVEFYNGGTKLGEDATSPYSFTWSSVPAGSYSLTAKSIDNSGDSASDVVNITVNSGSTGESCTANGSIQAEMWTGISGSDIGSIPVNSAPASVSDLTIFETPANIGDNYGTRVRGYVCVPATGNYTFWVASDDRSELWLSTDENPGNKIRIANVSGWTYQRQWDKYTTQRSSLVNLVAGQRYYIEALLKEGTGGDHLAVGWQLPGGALERPIPGNRLSKFEISSQATAFRQMETTEHESLYSQLNVYPNPAPSGDADLKVGGYENIKESVETQIDIINITGEVIHSEKVRCGGDCSTYFMRINKQLVRGVYLIKLNTNGTRSSKRLLIK